MRVQVSACGIALLLAGCLGPAPVGGGWRVFDSAFDGLENAKLVARGQRGAFDFTFEGASAFGHKAYYEAPLRAGETIVLAFRSDVGPQAKVTLEHLHDYRCDDAPTVPRPTSEAVDDARVSGSIRRDVGACIFSFTLKEDVVASNGVNLVWEATTIAFDARDRGPGGGAPLAFEAKRTITSIQNS